VLDQSAFGLDDLPLSLCPRLCQLTQDEAVTDDELPLPQDLRLPAVRLLVKAEFTASGDVIPREAPDRLAGLRRT